MEPARLNGLRRWMTRAGVGLLAVLIVLAGAGAVYEAVASNQDRLRYPPPGQLVDVGGYQIHLLCMGEGSPTVLLDASSGGWSAEWAPVQATLARTTRVCAWDRAGSGWSDLGTHAHTPLAYTDEMRAVLEAAQIAPPYVLVAASYSGRVARLYASRYPEHVVGVVFVDATHEDAHPLVDDLIVERERALVAAGNWVLSRLGVGRLLGPELVPFVYGPVGYRVSEDLRELITVLSLRPKNLEGNARLGAAHRTDDALLRAAGSLGDRPVVVLTSSQFLNSRPHWGEGQRKLGALSSNSTAMVTDGSHLIAWEHPDIVVSSIERVVTASRGGPRWGHSHTTSSAALFHLRPFDGCHSSPLRVVHPGTRPHRPAARAIG